MEFIFDAINSRIKAMRDYSSLAQLKANKDQQLQTDEEYRRVVNNVNAFAKALHYAKHNLGFDYSADAKNAMLKLFNDLVAVREGGLANRDLLRSANTDFSHIQRTIKKEWSSSYKTIAAARNTLLAIKDLDPNRIQTYLNDIDAAKEWTGSIASLEKLKNALANAELMIGDLNMDQEIVAFLTKVTGGEARVSDLNDNVLNWINERDLGSRIKVSFAG